MIRLLSSDKKTALYGTVWLVMLKLPVSGRDHMSSDIYLFAFIFMSGCLMYVDVDVYVRAMVLILNYLRICYSD